MGSVLAFNTGDARTGAGQLPQDFANFSPASVTSPCEARAMPAGGGASAMPVRNERADVCQPRGCLSLFVS
jgi:hypothetical protein